MQPLYFLTFSTYGTWLHGDPHGSVDHCHNQRGEALIEPNQHLEQYRRSEMRHSPLYFSDKMRQIVCRTLDEVATYRKWRIDAANVQANHVHILILASGKTPTDVMNTMKAYCTRRLREAELVEQDRTVWTECGSKRQLWDETSCQNAYNYILHQQHDSIFTIPQPKIEREA